MAEAMFKAGYPIGFGCGSDSTDANQTWGATFGAFGADLVDAKGNITIDSDNVMAAMEYCQKMMKFMPSDTVQLGRCIEQSRADLGQGGADLEPAVGLGGGQARCAAGRRGLLDLPQPARTEGPPGAAPAVFLGHLEVRQEQERGEGVRLNTCRSASRWRRLPPPVAGYDIPPFQSMTDLKIWSDVEPPKGTIYNYPVRPWHDAEYYIPGSSAPPEIAVQIWNRYVIPGMVGRLLTGQTIKQSMAWGKDELQGFIR